MFLWQLTNFQFLRIMGFQIPKFNSWGSTKILGTCKNICMILGYFTSTGLTIHVFYVNTMLFLSLETCSSLWILAAAFGSGMVFKATLRHFLLGEVELLILVKQRNNLNTRVVASLSGYDEQTKCRSWSWILEQL